MKNKVIIFFTALIFFHLTSLSQEISTIGEIYDFEIGDEFHRSGWSSWGGNISESLRIDKITDKFYSTNSDTLFYNINRQYSYYTFSNPIWTYYDTTIVEHYTNLNLLFNYGNVDSVYSDTLLFNGRLINSYYTSSSDWHYNNWIVNGCGVGYSKGFNFGVWGESEMWLVYYNKNGEEYGNPIIITNTVEEDYKKHELNVYPNPSTDKIFINYNVEDSKNQTIEIFNFHGNLVMRDSKINDNNNCIEISKLPSGIYILRLTTNSKILETKFVKE